MTAPDPTFARFISPDSIVPEPNNPQDLNRYAYVRNNPLAYVDPTGHAGCAAGDTACWQQEWYWKNRWYNAHGYGWGGSHWNQMIDPVFADTQILLDTVGEAGIRFAGAWDFASQMVPVATGIVKLGQKLSQGLVRLKELLGGGAVMQQVVRTPWYCLGAPACALPPGTNSVYFSTDFLANSSLTWIAQTTVHELAHIIDWHSRIALPSAPGGWGHFSDAWHGAPLTNYAGCGPFVSGNQCGSNRWERWAEAVTVWVYGDQYKGNERGALTVDQIKAQMIRIADLLHGWQ